MNAPAPNSFLSRTLHLPSYDGSAIGEVAYTPLAALPAIEQAAIAGAHRPRRADPHPPTASAPPHQLILVFNQDYKLIEERYERPRSQ